MASSNYERLPQEGAGSGDTDALYDERASTHSGPVRPPTYYGEGPFDPPSSEDEDESLLQKENTRSLGMMERAGYAEPDVNVRLHRSTPLLRPTPQLLLFWLQTETPFVAEISAHIIGYAGGDICRDWDCFCVHV